MNKFINLPNNDCYYTVTDSLVLLYPLDSKYVREGLEQLKKNFFFNALLNFLLFFF